MLSSGVSLITSALFGWGGGGDAQAEDKRTRGPADLAPVVVVFVIGGVTAAEAVAVRRAFEARDRGLRGGGGPPRAVLVGATCLATAQRMYEQVLCADWSHDDE